MRDNILKVAFIEEAQSILVDESEYALALAVKLSPIEVGLLVLVQRC